MSTEGLQTQESTHVTRVMQLFTKIQTLAFLAVTAYLSCDPSLGQLQS